MNADEARQLTKLHKDDEPITEVMDARIKAAASRGKAECLILMSDFPMKEKISQDMVFDWLSEHGFHYEAYVDILPDPAARRLVRSEFREAT